MGESRQLCIADVIKMQEWDPLLCKEPFHGESMGCPLGEAEESMRATVEQQAC
jgi:hypothetical protein